MRAWRELFLLFILFLCTCGYDSVRACTCRGGYFESCGNARLVRSRLQLLDDVAGWDLPG